MADLAEQSAPGAECPACGGDPEPDPLHNLSAVGYLHDDIHYECADCGNDWTHGVPIGEHDSEMAEELFCEACRERYAIPHRFEWSTDGKGVKAVRLHLKCPNCFHFWVWTRPVGEDQITLLVGHPAVTGSVEDATDAYAYQDEEV